jgi:hypothetical protein
MDLPGVGVEFSNGNRVHAWPNEGGGVHYQFVNMEQPAAPLTTSVSFSKLAIWAIPILYIDLRIKATERRIAEIKAELAELGYTET